MEHMAHGESNQEIARRLMEREDRYELTGPLPALAIPTTLQDSLMARLDRLTIANGYAAYRFR